MGFSGKYGGKWTNEPCSEVDEVVNHFWVLTVVSAKLMPGLVVVAQVVHKKL